MARAPVTGDARPWRTALRDEGRSGLRTRAPAAARHCTGHLFFFFSDATTSSPRLRELLAGADCRLLTLHGLGGVGQEPRLALAAANCGCRHRPAKAGNSTMGVFVVALDGVASPALFAQTVARGHCGLQPAGAATPLELLITFFQAPPNALLVLDNLEHTCCRGAGMGEGGVARQLAELLGGTSNGLKVLATSRETAAPAGKNGSTRCRALAYFRGNGHSSGWRKWDLGRPAQHGWRWPRHRAPPGDDGDPRKFRGRAVFFFLRQRATPGRRHLLAR